MKSFSNRTSGDAKLIHCDGKRGITQVRIDGIPGPRKGIDVNQTFSPHADDVGKSLKVLFQHLMFNLRLFASVV